MDEHQGDEPAPVASGRVLSLSMGPRGKGHFKARVDRAMILEDGMEGDGHRGMEYPLSALLLEEMALADTAFLQVLDRQWEQRTWNITLIGIAPPLVRPGDRLRMGRAVLVVDAVPPKPEGRCTAGLYGLAAKHCTYLSVESPGEIAAGDTALLFRADADAVVEDE